MTRRHSLFTRCLAVLLAMVLIASNGSGLAVGVRAAEADLFTHIQTSNVGTAGMNAVLLHAEAVPALNALNVPNIELPTAPDKASAKLELGKLTVEPVDGWVPDTYEIGTASGSFVADGNGAYIVEGLTVGASGTVKYGYAMTDYNDEIAAALGKVAVLADEAAKQHGAISPFTSGTRYAALQYIDSYFMGQLQSCVDGLTVEDLGIAGKDLNDDGSIDNIDAEIANAALNEVKDIFNPLVGQLNARMDGEFLRAYYMLKNYRTPKLKYYYENAEAMRNELKELSTCLTNLFNSDTDEEMAEYKNAAMDVIIEKLSADAGMEVTVDDLLQVAGELAEAVKTLEKYKAYENEGTKIALESEKAQDLCNALINVGNVSSYNTEWVLYSTKLPVTDDSYWYINDEDEHELGRIKKGDALTSEMLSGIESSYVAANAHCEVTIEATVDGQTYKIMELVGKVLTEDITLAVSIKPATYTYQIIGENDEAHEYNITGDATEIKLPIPEGYIWKYKIVKNESEGEQMQDAVINLELPADMDLIAQGKYAIKVIAEVDEIQDKLNALVGALNAEVGRTDAFVLSDDSLTANISMDELNSFGLVMEAKAVGEVLLNDEMFMLADGSGEPKLTMQTLIDALLAEGFDKDKIDDLVAGNEDALLKDDTITIYGRNLKFTLNLTEVPAEMASASNALAELEGYMTFDTYNGEVNVQLTLPEKVYELYLTKALVESEVKKDNAQINRAVAMEYVVDTLGKLVEEGADAKAFNDVLKAAGINRQLPAKFFDAFAKVITSADLDKATYTEDGISVKIDGTKDTIRPMLGEFGLGAAGKYMADEAVAININITLTNEAPKFQAVVVAPKAEGMMNKLDYTQNLSTVKGPAAVVLLDNVGSLSFNGNAILDLNGKTVDGNITVTDGTLYIVDSLLGNTSCGTVTGTVSGNAVITGGKFGGDVSGMLKTGYIQKDDGTVQNAMYTLSTSGIQLHKDFFTKANLKNYEDIVKSTAVDLAADLILNGYRFSSVNYDGYDGQSLFAAEYIDLLGLLKDKDVEGLIGQTVGNIGAAGISKLANDIIADLLDFDAVAAAVEGDGVIATYPISANHWDVDVNYNGEYITADLTTGDGVGPFNVPLSVEKLPASVKEYAAKALREMAAITNEATVTVTLNQPTYSNKTLYVAGSATAVVDVDVTVSNHYEDVYLKVLATAVAKGDADKAAELMADPETLKAEFDATTVEGVVNALMSVEYSHVEKAVAKFNEKFNKNVDISAYADKIEWAIDKAKAYGEKLINKLSDKVMSAKVGDFEIEDGVYGKEGANADAGPKYINGFKDYRFNHGVELTLEESTATVKVKLFGTEKDMGYLFLDLNPLTGKTLAELERSLVIDELGEGATLSIKNVEEPSYTGIAKTGMKVAITSGNKTLNYTLIVMGDTNYNGINDNGDITKTRNLYRKANLDLIGVELTVETLVEQGYDYWEITAMLAADSNLNGFLDNGDITRIRNKYREVNMAHDPANPEAENEAWNEWITKYHKDGTQY